jgi:hypothetical protein
MAVELCVSFVGVEESTATAARVYGPQSRARLHWLDTKVERPDGWGCGVVPGCVLTSNSTSMFVYEEVTLDVVTGGPAGCVCLHAAEVAVLV